MKRIIELDDQEVVLADELRGMLVGHPVTEIIRKKGYVDLRMPTEHWCKILQLLTNSGK